MVLLEILMLVLSIPVCRVLLYLVLDKQDCFGRPLLLTLLFVIITLLLLLFFFTLVLLLGFLVA